MNSTNIINNKKNINWFFNKSSNQPNLKIIIKIIMKI